MKTEAQGAIYCVDSSVLMNLGRHFKIGARPYEALWRNIEQAIDEGRLTAPEEVLAEIEQGTDDLVEWADRHRNLFVPATPEAVEHVKRLVATYGEPFAGVDKGRPHADPWLVALALETTSMLTSGVVVCEERPTPGRVPAVCQAEGLECIDHTAWFDREGWGFA